MPTDIKLKGAATELIRKCVDDKALVDTLAIAKELQKQFPEINAARATQAADIAYEEMRGETGYFDEAPQPPLGMLATFLPEYEPDGPLTRVDRLIYEARLTAYLSGVGAGVGASSPSNVERLHADFPGYSEKDVRAALDAAHVWVKKHGPDVAAPPNRDLDRTSPPITVHLPVDLADAFQEFAEDRCRTVEQQLVHLAKNAARQWLDSQRMRNTLGELMEAVKRETSKGAPPSEEHA